MFRSISFRPLIGYFNSKALKKIKSAVLSISYEKMIPIIVDIKLARHQAAREAYYII